MVWGILEGFPLLFTTIWDTNLPEVDSQKLQQIQIQSPPHQECCSVPFGPPEERFLERLSRRKLPLNSFLKCQKLANCWEKWLYFGRSFKRFRMAIGKPSPRPPEAKTVSSRTLRFSIFCKWALSFRVTLSFSIQVEFELYNQINSNHLCPQKSMETSSKNYNAS